MLEISSQSAEGVTQGDLSISQAKGQSIHNACSTLERADTKVAALIFMN